MTKYNFDFIKNVYDRNMLQNMSDAITQLRLWNYINACKDDKFIWSNSNEVNLIFNHSLTKDCSGGLKTLTLSILYKMTQITYDKFKINYYKTKYGVEVNYCSTSLIK